MVGEVSGGTIVDIGIWNFVIGIFNSCIRGKNFPLPTSCFTTVLSIQLIIAPDASGLEFWI
jgi:hypothetical protein